MHSENKKNHICTTVFGPGAEIGRQACLRDMCTTYVRVRVPLRALMAADFYQSNANALSKSSIKSSTSSMPTLKRISESVNPTLSLSSLGIEA